MKMLDFQRSYRAIAARPIWLAIPDAHRALAPLPAATSERADVKLCIFLHRSTFAPRYSAIYPKAVSSKQIKTVGRNYGANLPHTRFPGYQ